MPTAWRRTGRFAPVPWSSLAWDCPTHVLTSAIMKLASGESSLTKPPEDHDPLRNLTARERDIVSLLREGASNEAIAKNLGISYHTARTHVTHVLSKLGVSHRYAVVTKARGHDRLPPLSPRRAAARGAT